MSANRERALSRVVYFREAIELARARGESTAHMEEQLTAALVLANCIYHL